MRESKWSIHEFTPRGDERTAFEIHPEKDDDGVMTIASLDVFGKLTLADQRRHACLIAAAPDLLEACKKITETVDGLDMSAELWDDLHAAIAKAEGGKP